MPALFILHLLDPSKTVKLLAQIVVILSFAANDRMRKMVAGLLASSYFPNERRHCASNNNISKKNLVIPHGSTEFLLSCHQR